MVKPRNAAAIWIAINALLSGCQSPTRPGAEVVIGVDDAVAVLALERADQDDGFDRALASAGTRSLEAGQECDVALLHRRVIAHYDADRDGLLDDVETGGLRRDFGGRVARGKQRQVARLERIKLLHWVYDANIDRKLDADEWRALRDDLEARCINDHRYQHDREEAEQRSARIAAQFDLNHDGRLDTREQAVAQNSRRDQVAANWRTLIERFDSDGNGLLDAHERSGLREYERSILRGERVATLPELTSPDDAGPDAKH